VLNRFHRLLGDYAENLSMAALETHKYDGRGPRPDIAKLPGKRFVTASENKKTATLDEEMVKRVTGRDPVTARHLYKPEFTFEPAFKLWLMVNNKPEGIREDDVAMWSRIKFIPFLQSFAGREDMTLKDRLNDEDAGILTWAVQGAMLWQAHGLQPPAIVTAATQEYRAETDQLAAFIASRCVTGPTRVAKAGDLLRNYQEWVADNGQEQSYNHRTLTPALVLRGFAIDTTKPKAYTWLRGIGLVTERIDQ
jgi:putative DNA primase/helicase